MVICAWLKPVTLGWFLVVRFLCVNSFVNDVGVMVFSFIQMVMDT